MTLIIIVAVALSNGPGVDRPPVVTLVVLPGSSPGVPADDTPPPPASPVPTAPPIDTPVPYYYQEGFSDPGSGWEIAEEETWSANYVNGEYRLAVAEANTYILIRSSLQEQLADYEIVVDARQVEGTVDNNYGLLVRMQLESDDFYWFQISGDGYYRVSLHQADQTVNSVPWTQSSVIYQGLGATNRLRVVAEGPHFSFYVNGTHLTDVLNDTFPSGTLGLAVGTFDEPGVVIHFDDLMVRPLPE